MRPTASSLLPVASSMLLMITSTLGAQEPQVGARVRLDAPGYVAGDYVGTVLAHTGDTIRVVSGDGGAQLTIPMSRIRSLEISRGKSRSAGARTGMKWGIPIGVGLGILTGPHARVCSTTSFNNTVSDCRPFSAGDKVALVGIFAVSGAAWGAGIGALVGKEQWASLDLHRVGLIDLPGGRTGVGVSLAF